MKTLWFYSFFFPGNGISKVILVPPQPWPISVIWLMFDLGKVFKSIYKRMKEWIDKVYFHGRRRERMCLFEATVILIRKPLTEWITDLSCLEMFHVGTCSDNWKGFFIFLFFSLILFFWHSRLCIIRNVTTFHMI